MRILMRSFLTLLALLLVAGCNRNNNETPDERRAQVLTGPSSSFETAKEPPISAHTRFAAGQLAESQNDPNRAIAQYEACLKLEPDHTLAMYRLGIVRAQLKQYTEAIEVWQRYIKITDGAASGYSNLGFCFELSGDPTQAERAYVRGIEKDPKNQPCRVNYGLMLARHGRISDATAQLEAVLSPAEVAYNIGSIYEQQGKTEQAKAEYRKALTINPKLTDAQLRLASLDEKS